MKIILKIIAVIIIELLVAFYFVHKWFEDYSVKMEGNTSLPELSKSIPELQSGEFNWPSWKGENNDNSVTFTELQTNWQNGLKKLWEIKYLCKGKKSVTWSCPVIKGNRLIVPGRHDDKDYVFCLNPENGTLLWYNSYEAPPGTSSYGEGPRATPLIDEDRVYTLSRGGLLHCYSLFDGKKIWGRDLVKLGGKIPIWGFASSPFVYKDKLLVPVGESTLLVALNKFNGDIIWKTESGSISYSTPTVFKDTIIYLGGKALYGFNPDDGKTLWQTPWVTSNDINICTPVIVEKENIIIISAWYKKGIEAVTVKEYDPQILWKNNNLEAHQTDPFVLDKYIYGYSGMSAHNKDDFKCLDLFTGEEKWSTTDFGSGQFIYIKPYFLSLDIKGNLYLIKFDSKGYEIISKINELIKIDNARA
ncbi:hypothetical protein BVX93_00155, partial [bacterium B13(2017)]